MQSLEVPFRNVTLRQIIPAIIGAEHFRLRVSSKFGTTNLHVTNVSVALPITKCSNSLGSKSIDLDTLKIIIFSDSQWVIVADGAVAVSDPFSFGYPINNSETITVSMYLRDGHDSDVVTVHDASMMFTWMDYGERTRAASMLDEQPMPRWYFISAVEAWQEPDYAGFPVLGDSISDGGGDQINSIHEWPDYLFAWMQGESGTSRISVLNQVIAGNALLLDDAKYWHNRASRIERDVLTQSGIM